MSLDSSVNRRCFNRYYVPMQYLGKGSWPPTYIECDCGQLAKHIVHFELLSDGTPHFNETRVWQCATCGKKFKNQKGTFTFERLEEEKENEQSRTTD